MSLWSLLYFLAVFATVTNSSAIIENQESNVTYASHNAPCDLNTPCNPVSLLTCTSQVCQCESPSNQRWDNTTSQCVSTVGGQCSQNESVNNTEQQSESGDSIYRRCIPNAHCVSISGGNHYNYTECQCLPGYLENAEGHCVPGIGKPCNYGPDECNPLGMVVCKNGRCECLDQLQVYDIEMKRCVSPAGTHCKFDSLQLGCVKNAICYPFYYWIPPKCICKPGYTQTLNRTCIQVSIGEISAGNEL